jgi:putative membrane protein
MTTMSSERRLHPTSILFELGGLLPRTLLPLVVLFFAVRREGALGVLLIGGVIGMLIVVQAVVRYLRFSYRYEETGLAIRSGLLTRTARNIPYVRIQNLDALQNPLHRLLGVAEVQIQTGGGATPEASLRVLPVAALEEMRERVLGAQLRAGAIPDAGAGEEHAGRSAEAAPGADAAAATPDTAEDAPAHGTAVRPRLPRRTLLTLSSRELLLAGFIDNRGMVLILGALALLEQTGFMQRLVERLFQAEDAAFAGLAARWLGGTEVPLMLGAFYAVVALLLILLLIRLLSTLWSLVRLYGFTLVREGDELHTEYGLFTRVNATIPLRRVQTVIISDGVLHRAFGRRAVAVETAGGGAREAGAREREPIAPILHADQITALLDELQPGIELATTGWQPVHPRAFGRIFRAALAWPLALSIAAWFAVQGWAAAILVVLAAMAFAGARLRHRHLGWVLGRESITVRDGALTRTTRIARLSRVQVVAVNRNPFDLRTGMARLRADTAGAKGGLVIPYLPEQAAEALRLELVRSTSATAFTW